MVVKKVIVYILHCIAFSLGAQSLIGLSISAQKLIVCALEIICMHELITHAHRKVAV